MNDDRIRETLRRATQGEPGAGEAWVGFQRRLARAARWRNASVAVAGLAAVTALALVLPGLNSGPQNTLVPAPSEPGAQPLRRYTDKVAGFTFLYPADWHERSEPGTYVEVFPPGRGEDAALVTEEVCPECGGTGGGGDGSAFAACSDCPGTTVSTPRQFFVRLEAWQHPGCKGERSRPDVCYSDLVDDEGEREAQTAGSARVDVSETAIGERPAERLVYEFPDRPVDVVPGRAVKDSPLSHLEWWCAGCSMDRYLVRWFDEWQVDLRAVAPDPQTFSRYSSDLRVVTRTFARSAD